MAIFTGTSGNDRALSLTLDVLGFNILNLVLLGDLIGDTFNCGAGNDTVSAGGGDDILQGGGDSDDLSGGAGNDTIYAYISSDIEGSLVADLLNGNAGNDVIFGSNGGDTANGGDNDDTIEGHGGADLLSGGAGIDHILGGDGNDTVSGGAGDDSMDGGIGVDVLDLATISAGYVWNMVTGTTNSGTEVALNFEGALLGGGDDSITGTDGDNTIDGGGGDDTIDGAGGSDSISGGADNDSIIGGSGQDTASGGNGNDWLDGGLGLDIVLGGKGNDTIVVLGTDGLDDVDGGGDTNTLDVSNYTKGGLKLDLGTGQWDDILSSGVRTVSHVQVVMGTDFADSITGGADAVTIHGGGGNDRLQSGSASSNISGDNGNDTIVVMNDQFVDNADGALGTDWLDLRAIVAAGATVNVGGGSWSLLSSTGVVASIEGVFGTTKSDAITGSTGNDTLNGYYGADTLEGSDGNDRLAGGGGTDVLKGGIGNDIYFTDAKDHVLELAGQGIDTVRSAQSFTLGAYVENLTLTGKHDVDGVGNAGWNFIVGSFGKNLLDGRGGNDTVNGRSGSDHIWGQTGEDRLSGDKGYDTLDGGAGRDVLTGGSERDVFDYNKVRDSSAAQAGRDVITDFHAGSSTTTIDRIDLSTIDAIAGGADDKFAFITGAFTAAGQVRAVQWGDNVMIEVNTTGASGAEMRISLLDVLAGDINAGDFIL